MVGFEKEKAALEEQGVTVIAASVDPEDKSKEVQDEVSFPVCHGVGRDVAEALGSWWDSSRDYIQPSEFILGPDNKVMQVSYSDGPLARTEAGDVVRWATRRNQMAQQQK